MVRVLTLVSLSALLGLSGCSSKPGAESGGTPPPTDKLFEVAGLISSYSGEYKKAPTKVADLSRYENAYPIGYLAVKNGEIVVLWGVKMIVEEGGGASNAPAEVVAYDKGTPTEGGNVLLLNGQVKKMTADEFKAAPKAKK